MTPFAGTSPWGVCADGDIPNSAMTDTLFPRPLDHVATAGPFDYTAPTGVDAGDVDYLQHVALGLSTCPLTKVCDLTGDGKVDFHDIAALNQVISGKGRIDYNNDGVVNDQDVTVLDTWQKSRTACPATKFCDFANDGPSISLDDLTKFVLYVVGT